MRTLFGIDLSPAMLAQARRRARALGRRVELDEMDVTRLGFSDQSFDAAVGSFLFCVLPDDLQVPALREIKRILKPGGVLRAVREVWIPDQGLVERRRSMRRIMARRTKAAAFRAWRS